MFTKTITNFKQGMTPNLYGEGIVRIEHFDNTTEQARPFRALVASDMTHGAGGVMLSHTKFATINNIIYTIGEEIGSASRPLLSKWDGTNKYWDNFQSFNKDSIYAQMIFGYAGNLYGLWRDGSSATTGYLWKMTTAGSLTAQHQTKAWTNYCDPFYRKANNLEYLGIDNVIYSFDGTTLTAVFTHPLTTFVWTCIAENGIYIQLTGYDTASLEATSYLWDGDSTVNDVNQKYNLGYDYPLHTATLGDYHFFVLCDRTNTNIADAETQQSKKLIIKYSLNDGITKDVNTFLFKELYAYGTSTNGSIEVSGRFVENEKLYFGASVMFQNETTVSKVIFCLDSKGNLSIAQNLDVDTSTINYPCGILKQRDGWWFGMGGITATSNWNTTTTEVTSSYPAFFETPKYSSSNFTEDIDVLGYTVTFEPLASGASVVVKTRADAETAWTTIATFAVDDSVQGAMTGTGTNTVAERQFRIESVGGAVLTGWSVTFNGVANAVYHYVTK
jgi:hypothetical protein